MLRNLFAEKSRKTKTLTISSTSRLRSRNILAIFTLYLLVIRSAGLDKADILTTRCQELGTCNDDSQDLTPGTDSSVAVYLDLLTPVVNRKFYVRATLIVPSEGDRWYNKPIMFSGVDRYCSVYAWEFCNSFVNPPKDWTCDCLSRSVEGDSFIYRFFWYFPTVSADYQGRQIAVSSYGRSAASGLVEVVTFTSSPAPPSGLCKDTSKSFVWAFIPKSDTLKSLFQVIGVEWFQIVNANTMESRVIARIIFGKNRNRRTIVTSNYKENVAVADNASPGMFTLILLGTKFDDRTRIQIHAYFNKTRYQQAIQHFQKQRQVGSSKDPSSTHFAVNNATPSFGKTAISTTTTTDTNTTTTSTATVSGFNYPNEVDNFVGLIDDMELLLLTPPQSTLRPKIEIRRLVTGKFIITCSLQTGYMGNPPTNLTLMSQAIGIEKSLKVMRTRQGVSHLSYQPVFTHGLEFVCRLQGLAMKCVKPHDWAALESRGNQPLSAALDFIENIDVYFVMYGIQTFIILVVIMGIISDFIQHIHLIMWKRGVVAKKALDELEEMSRPRALRGQV